MKILFNQTELEPDGPLSLAALLCARAVPSRGVAVAVNGKVVVKSAWNDTMLTDGDSVIVITAVCGG